MLNPGEVVISRAQKQGFDFLPCIPIRKDDFSLRISDGIMLEILEVKAFSVENNVYVAEIITGDSASDKVYISTGFTSCLEKIPSKKRVR